jgi:hypothetical protein
LARNPKVLWNRQNPDCVLWWRIYPTLRCNCACTYCSAEFRHRSDLKIQFKRRHLSPQNWIDICSKLDTEILITGGEPFIYLGLMEIVEGIEQKVRINSNLGPASPADLDRLVERGNAFVMCSYHHGQRGALPFDDFARKVKILKEGGIGTKVSMVAKNPQHGMKVLNPVKTMFQRRYGIKASISHEARHYDPWPGTTEKGTGQAVRCETGCLRLVGPDGFRYPCQSKMARNVGQMEDLLNEDPTGMEYVTECREFGLCLPCDRHGPRKIENQPQKR